MMLTTVERTKKNFGDLFNNGRLVSDILKAMAHEGRLLILCTLAAGEESVSELESLLSCRQATVSQKLARLKLEGFVNFRRDCKTVYYSVKDFKILKIIQFLNKEFC
jgi:DNA-binding transcriptional ArsR family regulator